MKDPRDTFITKVVTNKSFADVGGLWGTVNEKVSVAHAGGARTLTMVDITPPGNVLWERFEERRQHLQLPEVQAISGDVQTLVETSPELRFDIVHCSGVLYHMPEPFRLLTALRKITREYLVLTSTVTAVTVKNNQGVLHVPPSAVLFLPALQPEERVILKAHWQKFVGDGAIGLTSEAPAWNLDDFAPWWWLPTPQALEALCTSAGFQCQERAFLWHQNAYAQLLAVR